MTQGSVHQDVLRSVCRAADIELGASSHAIFANVDWGHRVPIDEALKIWGHLAELDSDGTLGARLGKHQIPNEGVIGALLSAAGAQQTLGRAIRVLSRYWGLVSSTAELGIERIGEEYWVRSIYGPGYRNPVVAQSTLFVVLDGVREITGAPVPLLRVVFAGPVSASVCRRLEPHFQAPVFGGTGVDALVFEGAFAETELPSASRALRSTTKVEAETLPAEVGTLVEEVIKEIQILLPNAPHVEQIAKQMATTKRSLQRRLQGEGTNFREVCQQARVEIAAGYLSVGGTVSEVAFLVGYSDATAFCRAYRKSKGHAPNIDRVGTS